jgi:dihydrofolate reductase
MSTQAGNKVNLSMSVSADGFVAGPNQDEDNPLGVGGIELHRWHIDEGPESGGHPVNKQVMSEMMDGMGAFIMGRNMFGPIRGEWGDSDWKGWWGDDPPYHAPTYVLTHHAHDPIEMEGGTTFHFVTDGIESALEQATEAAGGEDVLLQGGADAVQQYLAAGLIDEMQISIVPLFLGDGARLFDNLGGSDLELEQLGAVEAPGVTHVRYRVSAG